MFTFGSLFAGIGGFDLALERLGFRVLWQVEKFRRVLPAELVRFVEEQGLPVELIAELTEQVQS